MFMFKKGKGQNENPENSSSSVPALYRNRSGVVELVGREPLMFARVENGVTKFSTKRKITKNRIKRQNFGSETAQFSVGNFHFFGRGKTNLLGGV